jgi:GntR family transcriptional regulator/MocR family aminotransferase
MPRDSSPAVAVQARNGIVFEHLKSEGYVDGSVGSGTYVSKVLLDELLQVARESGTQPRAQRKPRRKVSDYGKRVNPVSRS